MLTRIALFITTVGLLTACDSSESVGPITLPPPEPAPLQVGTWMLSSAEGQALPAYIAHRMVEGVLEQVYVDSAQIVVQEGGRFEQRIWTRTYLDGALLYRNTWVDAGSWRRDGAAYLLSSHSGMRVSNVRTAISPVLTVTESMVVWPGSGLVVGTYARRTGNPPTEPNDPIVTETRFRATDVAGRNLSARVITEPNVPHRGAETYTQLDSAWVILRSDGTYTRRAFYSTWTSPNIEFGLGYSRTGFYRDFDTGRWTRTGTQVAFASSYFQNRTASAIWSGDRMRVRQDMSTNDVFVDVGYSISALPIAQ